MIKFWKGNTHKDRLYANLPDWAIAAQDEVGAVNIVNFMHGGSGHLTPPWPWLFQNGLGKILEICDEKISELEIWTDEGIEKNRFYTATKIGVPGDDRLCAQVRRAGKRAGGKRRRSRAEKRASGTVKNM